MKAWRRRVALLLLIVGWFTIGWFARGLVGPANTDATALVGQAGQIISEQAYAAPDAQQLAHAAVRGMVNSLGDKYAVFWEPGTAERGSLAMQGDDAALGVAGEMQDGRFTVTGLTPGEPAALAGLQIGDLLVEIDGWQIKPTSSYMEVISMLRRAANTDAHIRLLRGGVREEMTISRAAPKDVVARTIGDVAYLRIDRFTDKTPSQVEPALKALLAAKPVGLIWDLRYNGGGRMTATQAVLDFFLDDGMAFYGRTRDGSLKEYPTRSGDPAEAIPLVVLIGPNTYSAGETAAASLLDRNRATLVGLPTHGKGMLNNTVPLADGSAIQLSVAQSLSPVTKTWYEGKGVLPGIYLSADGSAANDIIIDYAVGLLHPSR